MTTGTPGTTARRNTAQQVGYLRFKVNYNDAASGVAVNKQFLPAGALIVGTDVIVSTAFNAATTNTLSVGTVGDSTTNVVNAQSVTAGGFTSDIVPTGAALGPLSADKQIQVTYSQTGAVATAGAAYVVIKFVQDNDLNIGQ